MDFLRDVLVNWILGASSGVDTDSAVAAGAAIGGAAVSAGRFLALFIDPALFGAVGAAFAGFVVCWVAGALIAVIRGRF